MTQYTLELTGGTIHLGQELGRGGEGFVHAIDGREDRVVKIYTSPPDERKIRKLTVMAKSSTEALLRIAAWPIDVLRNSTGSVAGFVMPRIFARRDIHELYSPKSRFESFPKVDFRFITHAGTNIARAFAVVHQHGHVVGDVNHSNLLVGLDGTVMLIDCDSFQVNGNKESFTCDVGVPLFTAPELHGRPFRGLGRSTNHDNFGLAVLLFHLLFMGRHPFAGRFSGPGEMPIEKAIAELRFAYGPDRAQLGMDQPPGTLSLDRVGPDMARMFCQAFSAAGSSGRRPDALEWIEAMGRFEASLRECSVARWHHYHGAIGGCPWCAMESRTGVRLFGQSVVTVHADGPVDVTTLWQRILTIPDPGQDPAIPSDEPWTPPPGAEQPSPVPRFVALLMSIALCVFAIFTFPCGTLPCILLAYGVFPRVHPKRREEAARKCVAARTEWESAINRWRSEASRSRYDRVRTELEQVRHQLLEIPNERQRRMAQLEAEREARQKQRYLDRFRIRSAGIPGIGSGRTTMLESYGIETAGDVERNAILGIPGFGEVLTRELVLWRQGHERNFRFNPQEGVDHAAVRQVNIDISSRQATLATQLALGPNNLLRTQQDVIAARTGLLPDLRSAWNAHKLAEFDRNVVLSRGF